MNKRESKKQLKKKQRVQDLQKLYEDGKLLTDVFYKEMTNLIKTFLNQYLIKKGYYINGEAQTNFSSEDVDDCYTYVMSHIVGAYITKNGKKSFVKYDPTKGNITSYIHTWSRGYCSSILTKLRKEHRYRANHILALDDVLSNHTPNSFIEDDVYNIIEEDRDKELFFQRIISEGEESSPKNNFDLEKFKEFNVPYGVSNSRRKSI